MRIPVLSQHGLQLSDAQARNIERVVDQASRGVYTLAATLVRRSDSSSTDSSDSSSSSSSSSSSDSPNNCGFDDNSPQCQKYTSTAETQTLPIVLGVVIPLSAAFIVCIFLHRRYLRRQRAEDQNDPHKSLDFGMDVANLRGGKRGIPEMTAADLNTAHNPTRGISMDMTLGSPYLLPTQANGSRNSIHSLSRSLHDEHDPYRPVNLLHRPSNDNDSIRNGRPRLDDNRSLYSTTTNEKAGLIAHARPMSQSTPIIMEPKQSHDSTSSGDMRSPGSSMPPSRVASLSEKQHLETSEKGLQEISEKQLPQVDAHEHNHAMPVPDLQLPDMPPPRTSSVGPPPPRKNSLSSEPDVTNRRSSYYGDEDAFDFSGTGITIHEPMPEPHEAQYDIDPSMIYAGEAHTSVPATGPATSPALPPPGPSEHGQRLSVMATGNRLSVMGVRPLPPDVPEDNPEMRANRIRSFYREYFDDSKPNPEGQYEDEDYDFWDGAIYDPDSGGFFVPGDAPRPFAQAPGRRAMTPPPRGPPRGSKGSNNMHARKFSTYSMGRPGPRGRPMPQKKLPPPKVLFSLPTPHLLKNDTEVMSAIDFAPPSSFRQQQNGMRADTPQGVQRPFSPSVRPWTPLQSSFSTLTVMPSPHELRKSSTFTALDFAPPPILRDLAVPGTGNDAGSIRSNRSGISAMHLDAVRAGAYRVSRIPRGMVTTREDLAAQLRPQLNMISPA